MSKKIIVISLGGSIIAPKEGVIDYAFLKKFRALILDFIRRGYRFVIVCGGGKPARVYQTAAEKVVKIAVEDLDWLGIHSTRLNAHLIRTIFRDEANPEINKNPTKVLPLKKSILVAAGWKPGFSTDYDAVMLAWKYGAKEVINLSNVEMVYDKDPRKFKAARPFKTLSWREFRRIVGNKWVPGANLPFDPVASQLAQKIGLKVIILRGLANFKKYLNGRKFRGTIIEK